eukprot:CAMPEP_0182878594 /NCGR_PEP_ID=MMETSP0034_2-20130328/15454_1 /TAXON_ID=156128 /ORGANISM="Nephroselmis pyriformis, Strain CCMP717" /LENGTH=52 /DNA_ID=CAMNT_0025011487 /DNA_START=22 /DNA_END=176 /DNA_ORIENTATION=-
MREGTCPPDTVRGVVGHPPPKLAGVQGATRSLVPGGGLRRSHHQAGCTLGTR